MSRATTDKDRQVENGSRGHGLVKKAFVTAPAGVDIAPITAILERRGSPASPPTRSTCPANVCRTSFTNASPDPIWSWPSSRDEGNGSVFLRSGRRQELGKRILLIFDADDLTPLVTPLSGGGGWLSMRTDLANTEAIEFGLSQILAPQITAAIAGATRRSKQSRSVVSRTSCWRDYDPRASSLQKPWTGSSRKHWSEAGRWPYRLRVGRRTALTSPLGPTIWRRVSNPLAIEVKVRSPGVETHCDPWWRMCIGA